MKRCVWGITSVCGLVVAVGFASADYLVIKIDLNNLDSISKIPTPKGFDAKGGGKGGPAGGPGGGKGGPGGGMLGGGGMIGGGKGGPGGGMLGGGGMPGGGMLGGFGGMPGQGDPKGKKEDDDGNHHWIYVYLELRSKIQFKGGNTYVEFDHQFGDNANIPMHVIRGWLKKEPLAKEFAERMKKAGKDSYRVMDIATWALTHGGMKEFHQAMAELKKLNPQAEHIKTILENYAKVDAEVKRPVTEEDTHLAGLVKELKAEGYRSTTSDKGHYVLYTNVPKENEFTARRRLDRLEETFENFYYWFALQPAGARPEVPRKRLVVMLVNDQNKFLEKQKEFGGGPMGTDGFTPRRQNLLILSPKRLDDTFALYERNTQDRIKGFTRDELVSGKVWTFKNVKAFMTPDNLRNLLEKQTLAIVHRALEDESERATLTHEGTRQLLAASGLLPRTVEVPEWIQAGVAGYFETPYGAVYPGIGLPSWTHLVNIKHLHKTKKLGSPVEILSNLISDRHFRNAKKIGDQLAEAGKDRERLLEKQRAELEKGRAASWAFIYFLVQEKKTDHLARYCAEIDKLPRDLLLNEKTLQKVFAQAFDLETAPKSGQLDQAKFSELANRWVEEITLATLEIPEVEREMLYVRSRSAGPKGKSGGK